MTKLFVNATAVTGDGHKRSNPHPEPGPPTTKLQHIKDEVTYWTLRAYMRILKSICAVAESTSHHPQDEDR
jgi:hypothetical protein